MMNLETIPSSSAGRRRLKRPRPPSRQQQDSDYHDIMLTSCPHHLAAGSPGGAAGGAAAGGAAVPPHLERCRHLPRDAAPDVVGDASMIGPAVGGGDGDHRATDSSGGPLERTSVPTDEPMTRPRLPRPRRTLAATAMALVMLGALAPAVSAMSAPAAASPLVAEHEFLPAAESKMTLSSRLCSPSEDARAYVTTIAHNGSSGGSGGARGEKGDKSGDLLVGARVLAQSLRAAGAKGEVVVLVPRARATPPTLDSLRRDGLTVQIVPMGLQSAEGEVVSEELMSKVFLWSLTSYDRVVFLDPRSLIQKNPDALFACEGFCAAGAVHTPSSASSFRPAWARGTGREAGIGAGSAVAATGAALPSMPGLAQHGLEDSSDDDNVGHKEAAAAVLEKPLSTPPPWQPSTSVMVLEPSLAVHAAMLDELTRTPAVGSLEAQVFLSSFLLKGVAAEAGDRCVLFQDPLEVASSERQSNGGGSGLGDWKDGVVPGGKVLWAGDGAQDIRFDGGGSNIFLEDALTPVVLLNGPHLPRCSARRKRTADGVCQRLPYTFAAPATDFSGTGSWGARNGPGTPGPHIIHIADDDTPWKRLAYLHKPLFWKWNVYRQHLEYPRGSFFAQWVLFFIPCVVLAFARVYYKNAGRHNNGGVNDGTGRGSSGGGTSTDPVGDSSSPYRPRNFWMRSPNQSARRQQPRQIQQVAILPACGIAVAYDGTAGACIAGPVINTSPAAGQPRTISGGSSGSGGSSLGFGMAVGVDQSSSSRLSGAGGRGQSLPVGARSVLSALVGVFGLLWCRAAQALVHQVVDPSWHPIISVLVHDAWLCCAFVIGLYVMDYLHYARVTRMKTLRKDSVVVASVVAVVWALHARVMDASGGGGWVGGEAGVLWAGAIGIGVIGLGLGHGSRPDVVHRLSGRVHLRCVVASCVIGTAISLAVCCLGRAGVHLSSAGRRTQSAVATAQMAFVALVYASLMSRVRLLRPNEADEAVGAGAGSRILRSCSTASLVSEALMATMATAPGNIATSAVASSMAALSTPKARTAAAVASGTEGGGRGGGVRQGWMNCWALLATAAARAGGLIWQRRWVAACVAALGLWKVSSTTLLPKSPAWNFEKHGQSCLESQGGLYVDAGIKRLSRVCGAEQALRPVATGAYFEAFRQYKVCLEVAGGGFLTLGRVHVAQTCLPEHQFVFQPVVSVDSSKQKAGGRTAAKERAAAAGKYCVYNPTSGFYLSAQGRPRAQCGPMEHWRVKPAPRAPGLKGFRGSGPLSVSGKAISKVSALLHPNFSRAPLHTFMDYLWVATAILIARAVFSMMATSPCVAGSSHRRGNAPTSGGGGSRHHRGLGARQRSTGRFLSRSRTSFGDFLEAGYQGDAGYVGDAEMGGAGYGGYGSGGGDCSSSSSSSSRMRSPQRTRQAKFGGAGGTPVSPVAESSRRRESAAGGWEDAVATTGTSNSDMRGDAVEAISSGGNPSSRKYFLKRRSSEGSAFADRHGSLAKLFSGLVAVCNATLLAGLWCLIPAHFAQALSALALDHHSAIDQGLGMVSDLEKVAADSASARNLEGGVDHQLEYTILLGGVGPGRETASPTPSCDSSAWWLMSALIRWHLLLLLVAFCHLHGAAVYAAATSASTSHHRWRSNRRLGGGGGGKKAKASAAAEQYRRSSGSFLGLKYGERLAVRLRTAFGVLTLLCAAAASVGSDLGGDRGSGGGLRALPSWGRCAQPAGLDESWGTVSPLLVFAVVAATAGVYLRAGSSLAVRCGAGVALVAGGAVVAAAAGRQYLTLAVVALAMDWSAWVVAGVLACVCYASEGVGAADANGSFGGGSYPAPAARRSRRDSSGSSVSDFDVVGSGSGGGGDNVGVANRSGAGAGPREGDVGARQRITAAARRMSPRRWIVRQISGRTSRPRVNGCARAGVS